MKHFTIFVLIVFLLCLTSIQSASSLDYAATLVSGGLTRSYLVHVPANIPSSGTSLLVALHGGSGDGRGMQQLTNLNALADQKGFITVYPDGLQKTWADGRGTTPAELQGVNDVAFLSSLVRAISSQYKINTKKVFATGISNGGFMATKLACEASSIFVAVAVVSATMPQNLVSSCKPIGGMPFLLIHGTADTFVPASGGVVTKGNGGKILSTAATINFWKSLNGCNTATSSNINPLADGTSITLEQYQNCSSGHDVWFYKILGGGHTWAGGLQYLPEIIIGKTSQDINANEVIWQFFQQQ